MELFSPLGGSGNGVYTPATFFLMMAQETNLLRWEQEGIMQGDFLLLDRVL
jgi:hypothetical protein